MSKRTEKTDAYEFTDDGLGNFLRAIEQKGYYVPKVKIGIIGDKDARTGISESNATVGAMHEFGTTKMSKRSFLREPITDNMASYLEKSGAFTPDILAKVLKEGTVVAWLKQVAIVAEQVVSDAFRTGGFGKWKPSQMDHKKVHQTLVETRQLQRSISSVVE